VGGSEPSTCATTLLESVLKSSTETAIIAADVDGVITTFNAGAERIYGWTRCEAEGTHISAILRPEDAQGGLVEEMMAAAQSPEERFAAETIRRTRAGKTFAAQVAFTVIRDPSGTPSGFLDVSSDVSKQQAMRRKLLLSEKMASLGTLAAGVAHEFNNLLQGIIGFLGHALRTQETAKWERAMKVGLEAANRAASLTERLQAFARPNLTGVAPVCLRGLVEDTCGLVESSFKGEDVHLLREYEEGLPPALVDRSRISQVLLNLVTNARHAVLGRARREIRISVLRDGEDGIAIQVSDTGCGIPEEVRGRIFEPFFTTKGALGGSVYDGKVHGTGLGLAISSGIVLEHGGSLDVDSCEGEGTTFTVRLPRAEGFLSERPELEPEAVPERTARARSLRVLVVDDEELVRDFLVAVLEERGHHAVAAENGPEALELLGSHGPDVVIADRQMPHLDGVRFLEEVRQRSEGAVRRILITGGPAGPEAALAATAFDGFLAKPFRETDVLRAVEGEALSPSV